MLTRFASRLHGTCMGTRPLQHFRTFPEAALVETSAKSHTSRERPSRLRNILEAGNRRDQSLHGADWLCGNLHSPYCIDALEEHFRSTGRESGYTGITGGLDACIDCTINGRGDSCAHNPKPRAGAGQTPSCCATYSPIRVQRSQSDVPTK